MTKLEESEKHKKFCSPQGNKCFLKYYFYDLLKNYFKIYENAGQFYYPSKLICLKAWYFKFGKNVYLNYSKITLKVLINNSKKKKLSMHYKYKAKNSFSCIFETIWC